MCFWFRRKKKKVEEEVVAQKEVVNETEVEEEVDIEKELEGAGNTEVIEEANKTTILGKKVYHVNKRATDNKWTIKFAYGKKVIKTFDTKTEAVEFANKLADNQGGVVLVHASRGVNKGKIVLQGWDAYNAKMKAKAEATASENDDDDTDVIEEEEAVKTTVVSTKVYHVNKRTSDDKWTIKFAYGKKVIRTFATKAKAVQYANKLAENQGGIVLVHASKGANKGKIALQGWDAYNAKKEKEAAEVEKE